MSPLMNNLLVFTAIAAAIGYFIWHGLSRKRTGGSGCGGGCGCTAEKKPKRPV